jgi:trimethylamine---corrinoid protein Co-methyltransferase
MNDRGLLSLPPDRLQAIHDTAVRILAETGIKLDHTGMLERLVGQGCRLEKGRLFIPAELVDQTLGQIPASFNIYGRSPEDSLAIGLENTCYTNTGILPNIYDLESGRIRRATLADVEATTRLLDAMDNVHAVYVSLVDATDVEPELVTLNDFAATLAHTTKPLVGPGLANGAEAEAVVAMARALRGGDSRKLREFPPCIPFVCPVSPLRFPKGIIDALMVIAEAGLPLDALTNPVMGLTSAYSVAGSVALGHAEVLALAVMAHTISPGLPILNQNTPSVADMKSLASTVGGPETGLIRHTVACLSHHLAIPVCVHGHTSSARLDFQAAEEKALNSLLLAFARPSLLGGLGALANVTTAAYEAILLDNERYGAIRRLLQGVQVDEDHLGFKVMNELVETGTVLGSDFTLKYLHSDEVWQPRLAQRQGLVNGVSPVETSLNRARAEAGRLLASHRVEPLAEQVQAELREIIEAFSQDSLQERGLP